MLLLFDGVKDEFGLDPVVGSSVCSGPRGEVGEGAAPIGQLAVETLDVHALFQQAVAEEVARVLQKSLRAQPSGSVSAVPVPAGEPSRRGATNCRLPSRSQIACRLFES